jgi:hypothetical protein
MIINMKATKGFVVPAGGGKHLDMTAPGRFASLKLCKYSHFPVVAATRWRQVRGC